MKEHDIVKLKNQIDVDGVIIPAGTRGTIVHSYEEREAFEVEFSEEYNNEVVTLMDDAIEPANATTPQGDPTEETRRELVQEINSNPNDRESLEKRYGKVWDTNQLSQDFEVTGFMAPYVVVRRKADGVIGSLEFQHMPRFYYSFTAD